MCGAQVMDGFFQTLERIAILLKVRQVADSEMAKLWELRKVAIEKDPLSQKTFDNYPTYPTSAHPEVKEFCTLANSQLAMYRGRRGIFARDWVMDSARDMPAHLWWDQNGGSVPELQAFARMILAQPASASICERINSEFEFVKDRRRNRLSHKKADVLVGLFHNLRLLKRMKKPQYTEPAIAWTDDLEKSGVIKYAAAGAAGSSSLLTAGAAGSPSLLTFAPRTPGSYLPPLNEDIMGMRHS